MAEPEPLMFTTREEWRAWLEENHDHVDGVWLAYYKKATGKPSVTYEEAVEEAICFGWIDSNVKSIDSERYRQWYSRRNINSAWSESNKDRVVRMIAQGKMTEAGMAAVRAAKSGGHWEELAPVENLVMSPELETALAANPRAQENFSHLSPSHKKQYLFWIHSAKTDETRKKRIKKTVKMVAQNKRME
jgi:uncharacterized protein YdeI (YjbR/CyaY-like superfamily)